MHERSSVFGAAVMAAAMVMSLTYAMGDGNQALTLLEVLAGHAGDAVLSVLDSARQAASMLF